MSTARKGKQSHRFFKEITPCLLLTGFKCDFKKYDGGVIGVLYCQISGFKLHKLKMSLTKTSKKVRKKKVKWVIILFYLFIHFVLQVFLPWICCEAERKGGKVCE